MTRGGKSRRLGTPAAIGICGLLLVLAAATAGCVQPRRTVNVSKQAKLAQARRLEIAERDTESPGGYAPRLSIADGLVLSQLSDALDVELPLGPLADCLPRFRLDFVLQTGEVQSLYYLCAGETSFLYGPQPFWSGQQVQPPAGFDAAMSNLL